MSALYERFLHDLNFNSILIPFCPCHWKQKFMMLRASRLRRGNPAPPRGIREKYTFATKHRKHFLHIKYAIAHSPTPLMKHLWNELRKYNSYIKSQFWKARANFTSGHQMKWNTYALRMQSNAHSFPLQKRPRTHSSYSWRYIDYLWFRFVLFLEFEWNITWMKTL